MADIFDITVASMKLGLALPVPNPSFKFWQTVGASSWSDPEAWTETSVASERNWTGYDDTSAVALTAAAVPDSNAYYLASDSTRWRPDSYLEGKDASSPWAGDMYYSIASRISAVSGGGANVSTRLVVGFDSTAAFSSPTYASSVVLDTSQASALTLHKGTRAFPTLTSSDVYVQARLVVRDATTVITGVFDNVGLMWDPIAGNGYYELTNVYATTLAAMRRRHTEVSRAMSGSHTLADASGGSELLRLEFTLQDESMDVYENLLYLFNLNHGTPGMSGLPLLVEPNVPGYPPTFMCNFAEGGFPLNWNAATGFCNGTIVLESVY